MSELPTIDWWGDGIKAYPDNDMMKSGAVPNQSLVVQAVSYTHLTLPTMYSV